MRRREDLLRQKEEELELREKQFAEKVEKEEKELARKSSETEALNKERHLLDTQRSELAKEIQAYNEDIRSDSAYSSNGAASVSEMDEL